MKAIFLAIGGAAMLASQAGSVSAQDAGAATERNLGSGWDDMQGKTVRYLYEDFSGFLITWLEAQKASSWNGYQGYHTDVVALSPGSVASKVADGVYFYSWGRDTGGDNVVHNYNSMELNAHLGQNGTLFRGVIICREGPNCVWPGNPPMDQGSDVRKAMMARNIRIFNLRPGNEVPRPFGRADIAAMYELAGKEIVYEGAQGPVRIEVDAEETRVQSANEGNGSFQTSATKIAEGIYFISWPVGNSPGQHIMVNANTGQVFDHVTPPAVRSERIYNLTCFDSAEVC